MPSPQTVRVGPYSQANLEAEDFALAALARSRKRLAGSTAGSTGPLGLQLMGQALDNTWNVMPSDREGMRHVAYRLFQSGRLK